MHCTFDISNDTSNDILRSDDYMLCIILLGTFSFLVSFGNSLCLFQIQSLKIHLSRIGWDHIHMLCCLSQAGLKLKKVVKIPGNVAWTFIFLIAIVPDKFIASVTSNEIL